MKAVSEASKSYGLLGFKGYQGQADHQVPYLTGHYIHPAFLFIKRELLEKTSKDFSARPDKGADHFGLITQELERMKVPIWYTQENGFTEEDAFHQGGINMNYLEFGKEGFVPHRSVLFYIYNHWSMKAEVDQDPKFMELCQRVSVKFKELHPKVDPENNPWVEFYK